MNTFYRTKNNTIIEVNFDEFCTESPREWDNLATMITWESRYNSPDENEFEDIDDFLECFGVENSGNFEVDFKKLQRNADKKGFIIKPLYKLDHTQISYSTEPFNDPWDSGMVGFMYVEKQKVYDEYGVKRITKKLRETILDEFEAECDAYTYWVNGWILDYVEYDLEGNEIDCSCGYYGLDVYDTDIATEKGITEEIGEFYDIGSCLYHLKEKDIA